MKNNTRTNDTSIQRSGPEALPDIFPKELQEILKRRSAYQGLYSENDIERLAKDLGLIETAEEEYRTAEEELAKFKGVLSWVQNLSEEKKSKKETCQRNYESKRQGLNEQRKTVKISTRYGLVGLAFSGGGIRSATFNLGVLQSLAKNGIIKYVDYLSTVSGGGYLGACLSSILNVNTASTEWKHFPFRHIPGEEEPDAVKKLRNSGNYLAPDDFLDKIRIPALLLRGIFINFLTFLPYLILAVLLTNVFFGDKIRDTAATAGFVITESSLRQLKRQECSPSVLNALAPLQNQIMANQAAASKSIKEAIGDTAAQKYESMILKSAGRPFEWRKFYLATAVAAGLFAAYVLLFPLGQWVFRRKYREMNWNVRNWYGRSFGMFLAAIVLAAIIESLPPTLLYLKLNWWDAKTFDFWSAVITVLSLIPYAFSYKATKNVSRWTGKLALSALGLLGPMIFVIIYFQVSYWNIFHHDVGYLGKIAWWPWIYLGAVVLWLFTILGVDVNTTSLHGFYRDRLSKAYLFLVRPKANESTQASGRSKHSKEVIEPNDAQQLHKLNQENTLAPYHLINATLNLQNSDDVNLRGRDSDLFIFSRHYTGCERTGFIETEKLEKLDQHMDLGTAMAISGAAAAPNMGTTTIRPLVFIMTMLNVRLGYWMPNPRHWNKQTNIKKPGIRVGVGPFYLLRELFSRINENRKYINVSDGGHIENLGVYQLLRRRCKFIIACDAEADADMSFGGLAKLIRYARTDMGIDIDIELDDVLLQNNGLSRRHCAMGTIRYGKEESGRLLYIKSSLTGDENEYIRQYRTRNPAFPHESTADQFFDEAQFEVYRALGHHIVEELFRERQGHQSHTPKKPFDVRTWFEHVTPYLQPKLQMEEDHIKLHDQLGIIEEQLKDPDVAEYTYQIYPELSPGSSPAGKTNWSPSEQSRKIFHLCNLQMQLMENVYLALNLDDPIKQKHHFTRGWMNLFRRWAQSGHFRSAWAVSIGTYSVGFQTFCNEALGLRCGVRWSQCSETDLTSRERTFLHDLIDADRFDKNKKTLLQGEIVKQDQILIAEMYIRRSEDDREDELISFPIGFAVVRICNQISKKNGKKRQPLELIYYSIRRYYQKMQLLKKLIPKLKMQFVDVDGKPFTEIQIDLNNIPDTDRGYLRYFFEDFGYKIME